MLGRIKKISVSELHQMTAADLEQQLYAVQCGIGTVAVIIPYRLYSQLQRDIATTHDALAALQRSHALQAAMEIASLKIT